MVYDSPHKKRPREGDPLPWGGTFDERDYPRGAIKSIRVENFMTYGSVMVYPGPKLNLVLGPNGSGKSSLVCAVGLGLCANANTLGRSKQLKEFVRKGYDKASVEIMVSGGPDKADYRIERQIFNDNKSSFKINGRNRSMKEVEKQIADLNIQLDNLCQFLPQEKVVEFSKMTPEELLINTERAIDDASLFDMHNKLIHTGKDLKEKHTDMDITTRQLENKKAEKDNMKHEVEKINQHDRLRRDAGLFRARAAQLAAANTKDVLHQRTESHNQENLKLAALKKALEKRKKPMQNKQNKKIQLKEDFKRMTRSANKQEEQVKAYIESVDEKEAETKAMQDRIIECENRENDRKSNLQVSRQQHTNALDEREALPDHPEGVDPQEEKTLADQRRGFHAKHQEISAAKRDIHYHSQGRTSERKRLQHQLSQIRAVSTKRIQALDQWVRAGGRLRQFVEHVEKLKQRGSFRGTVVGPIAAEVSILSGYPAHAASALENAVPNRAWSAFVVEHAEDQRLIRDEAKRMNLAKFASVMMYDGNVHAPLNRPHGGNERFAEFGTVASLDTVFESHPLVKHALAGEVALTNTFLVQGDEEVDNIFNNSPITQLYSPHRCHRKTVSRYNKQGISLSQYLLKKAFLLAESTDEHQVQDLERRLAELNRDDEAAQASLQEMEEESMKIDDAQAAAEHRLKAIQSARQQHAAAKRKVEAKVKKLEQSIQALEKDSPLIAKPKLEKQLKALGDGQLKKLKEFVGQKMPEMLKTLKQRAVIAATTAQLEDELTLLSASCQNDEAAARETEQSLRELQRLMDEARHAHNAANSTWTRAKEKDMEEGDEEELEKLPEDVGECEARAEEKAAEAERLCLGDRGTLDRYKTLVADVDQLTEASEQKQAAITKLQEELNHAKEHWLPQLLQKVDKVSKAFSENFARIGSVGEVALHEEGENYDAYAIHIKVKFRQEGALEVLSPAHHSGGEKSVSTIMYLLSLQGITQTPFRVVDEINQGMDQTNERKVFQAMVDASKKRGTAQCLLMTPKLLPQLDYGDCVNVLGIQNAAHIKEVAKKMKPSLQLESILGIYDTSDE